jgi:large subunit ribosomal protein L15
MPEQLNLSSLQPAQERKDRKRIGRGPGSGKGRYSGRGIKGQKSRSGSHAMRAGFEGGQMPIYMRLGKLRGSTSKDAMPIGPFRTYTQPVNLRDLETRFAAGAEVTPESLVAARLLKNTKVDVKVLGDGELTKKLVVSVHAISASAREKIEAAGGTVTLLREPKKRKAPKSAPAKGRAADEDQAVEEETAAEVEEAAKRPVRGSGPGEDGGNREVPPATDEESET